MNWILHTNIFYKQLAAFFFFLLAAHSTFVTKFCMSQRLFNLCQNIEIVLTGIMHLCIWLQQSAEGSSRGRTTGSGPVNPGSNPGPSAT